MPLMMRNIDNNYNRTLYFKSFKCLENYFLKYCNDLKISAADLIKIKNALAKGDRHDCPVNVKYVSINNGKSETYWNYTQYEFSSFNFES